MTRKLSVTPTIRSFIFKPSLNIVSIKNFNTKQFCGISECRNIDSGCANTKVYETDCGHKVEKYLDNEIKEKYCRVCRKPIQRGDV